MIRLRRPLFALALLGACLWAALGQSSRAKAQIRAKNRARTLPLYVGGNTREAGDGLGVLRFDLSTGTLSQSRVAARLHNPDWLTLSRDGRTLYAGGALDHRNGLTAFAVENDGSLREISSQPSDENPVSLAIDATQKWLIGAYYGSGNWGVWSLQNDGKIGERVALIQHRGSGPNLNRQASPHPHQAMISPDNSRIWICDLGTDRALIYDFDAKTGAVQPSVPASVALPAGSGPRHLAFNKSGGMTYVVNELNSTISVFEGSTGHPRLVQTVSTLPAGFAGANTGAEISLSPDGRFVLASNRGFDSIAVFQISREGRLFLESHTKVGREPRHFTFDPSGKWLLVGNQQSRSIEVFAFDAKSGKLFFQSRFSGVPNEPTCLVFGR